MHTNHSANVFGTLPLTEAALCAWVGQAAPADQLIYHRGFLAADIAAGADLSPSERQQLRRVASRARKLFEQGLVNLLQRREAPGEYTYLAIARPRAKSAVGALDAVLQLAGMTVCSDAAARRSA